MQSPSGISRRIASCLQGLNDHDYEFALVNLFPALDKTAKKRRTGAKVGERIRAFLRDEEVLISVVATGNAFKNINVNGITFPDAIYKFGRTSIAHEGELDPRLVFNDTGTIQIGSTWNLPSSYIPALCISVIVAPENSLERLQGNPTVQMLGHSYTLNELWGQRAKTRSRIADQFKMPDMFQ